MLSAVSCRLTECLTKWYSNRDSLGYIPISPSDQSIMDISCGDAHNCALTASSQAYCWGDNSVGQLGVALSYSEVNKPRAVLTPTGQQLIMVACGANFSVALSSELILLDVYDVIVMSSFSYVHIQTLAMCSHGV